MSRYSLVVVTCRVLNIEMLLVWQSQVIVELTGKISTLAYKEAVLPSVQTLFEAPDWTPETLALALAAQAHHDVCWHYIV